MSNETLFEFERGMSGRETATLLQELADGLADGTSIELTDGDRSITIGAPADLSVEIELERGTGEDGNEDRLELELEFEWEAAEDGGTTSASEDDTEERPADRPEASGPEQRDESSADAGIVARGGPESMARFQVFRDRADEWRWRLVHRNGNVIATSGEGYTTRRNAEKGLRSVVANAPGADVEDGG